MAYGEGNLQQFVPSFHDEFLLCCKEKSRFCGFQGGVYVMNRGMINEVEAKTEIIMGDQIF